MKILAQNEEDREKDENLAPHLKTVVASFLPSTGGRLGFGNDEAVCDVSPFLNVLLFFILSTILGTTVLNSSNSSHFKIPNS